MRFFKNIFTVVMLFTLAYSLYADWSLRDMAAFVMFGFAVHVLLDTIFPEAEPESENE